MALDRIDCGILDSLQKDGRMTNKELASANGISPSTCLERVRRLQDDGTIVGYRAIVNPAALGIGVQAMIAVRMSKHGKISFDEQREGLLAIPEVISVYLLGGSQDYLIHVATRDVAHLRNLLAETFTSQPNIAHVETSLIFEFARSHVLPNYSHTE